MQQKIIAVGEDRREVREKVEKIGFE